MDKKRKAGDSGMNVYLLKVVHMDEYDYDDWDIGIFTDLGSAAKRASESAEKEYGRFYPITVFDPPREDTLDRVAYDLVEVELDHGNIIRYFAVEFELEGQEDR